MRNKGFFWSITIALALACIYQLTFTMATSRVESDAVEYAEGKMDSLSTNNVEYIITGKDTLELAKNIDSSAILNQYREEYIRSKMNEVIHFGYTYAECKGNEINLGLDLKGGMSATLEISVPELVHNLAGETKSQQFLVPYGIANTRTNAGEGAFIDLFVEEFEKANPEVPLARLFHMHNPDELALDASNDEVASFLKEQAVNALDGVEIIIEKRVNQFGVAQPTIQKQPATNRIFIELPGVSDRESVRKKLQATANLEFFEIYDNEFNGISGIILQSEGTLGEELFGSEDEEVVETIVVPDSSVIDSTEIDPLMAETEELLESDENLDSAAIADMTDAEKTKKFPISSLMSLSFQYDETGKIIGYRGGSVVGYAAVKDTATLNVRLKHPAISDNLPPDLVLMWDAKENQDEVGLPTGVLALHAIKVPTNGAKVSGKDIDYAELDGSQIGKFGVRMVMNSLGAEKWKEMTTENLNQQVAITMDNLVFSAPVVNDIMSTSSSITGSFTMAEAQDLAGLLNAGALPAPVRIVDESMVGPSLGADNINSGLMSFGFALLIVLIYMVFYYNKAGLVADAALLINIFLLIGALASLKAILTLPGIAGIVLTIGMSVDANVLIFERIREELRIGKGMKAAIKEGYSKALSAILDANITTLLTGFVLAIFGTGPIKGFATTLIIGIFTSFFAAVIITRLIITAFVDRDKKMSFSTKITEKWFVKSNIQFVKKRKLFYILSSAVIVLGFVSLMTRGLDYGVDFEGGRQYKIVFEEPANYDGIRTNLTELFDGNEPGVKMVDNSYTALVTTKYRMVQTAEDTSLTEINNEVEALVVEGIKDFGVSEIVESKMIAPTISSDLKKNSFYAVGLSLLIIFLYILFRFRKWQFGLGALIAMAHDVLIVLALFSICYGWIGFSLEVDQAFIAAILTVVGYSINDTVVVFDRIREYLLEHPKREMKETINSALNSTLGRTVNTSLSTFIVLLVIFLFGGDAIKGFVFALMIGIVVGTYSSLFIATPLVIDLAKKNPIKMEPKNPDSGSEKI